MDANIKNRISGFFFLFLGIFLWFAIPYQIKSDGMTMMGPDFFPKFLSVGLMLLSLLLIIQSFVKKGPSHEQKAEVTKFELKSELRVFVVFLIIVLYIIMMPLIGFVIATILFMGIVMFILKVKKWYFYGILVGFSFIVYYLFEKLLYVQLP